MCIGKRAFPGGTSGKESDNAVVIRDASSVPGLGRSSGGGLGNLLQYPFLENPMDRGAWGHKESDITELLHA